MGKTLKTVLLLLFMGLSIPATALELHVFLQNGDEEIVDLGSVENLDYDSTGEILQIHFTGGGQQDFLLEEIRNSDADHGDLTLYDAIRIKFEMWGVDDEDAHNLVETWKKR